MLLIVGTFRVPPQMLPYARSAMKRMIDASKAEPGCLEYCYAEDLFDAGLIHVKEIWSDRAAVDRHLATRHLAEWRDAWPALGIRDRDLRLYEVGAPRQI